VAQDAVSRGGRLIIENSAGLATTASVRAVGPAGEVPVTGLDAVAVPAGGSTTVTVPPSAGGFPLVVEAGQPVVVEWQAVLTSGDRSSPVASLALPVLGG
jgi:hypothetical protein